jgi:NAD(P)-dependent dehydrogenase (short-subunit alcohol dehydrogenase family)
MDRLKGKRSLITGGSSGIGLETARQFVAEGARVAITARSADAFKDARQTLGDGVVSIVSDAGDACGHKKVAERIEQGFAGLDVLFVNAGLAELKPVDQWDEAAIDRSFHTNVRGPFFLIQALLPLFSKPRVDRAECFH